MPEFFSDPESQRIESEYEKSPSVKGCLQIKKIRFESGFSVGAGGFEPPTSRTRTVHSIRTEPRPEQRSLV